MNRIISRLQKQAEEKDLSSYFKGLGFYQVSTGGGCTAYQYDLKDGDYIWATDEEGIQVPMEDDAIISLGWYHDDDTHEGVYFFDNLEQFKSNINKFINDPENNFKDMF